MIKWLEKLRYAYRESGFPKTETKTPVQKIKEYEHVGGLQPKETINTLGNPPKMPVKMKDELERQKSHDLLLDKLDEIAKKLDKVNENLERQFKARYGR